MQSVDEHCVAYGMLSDRRVGKGTVMAIRIELAQAKDASDIATLIAELLDEIMATIGDRAFDVDVARTTTLAREWLANGNYHVMLARDPPGSEWLGLLTLYEGYALYAGGRFGTIPELYVRPPYRSQGIGARLITEAGRLGRVRGWKRLEVNTPPLPQFDRTLAFYERQGFRPSGGRKLKLNL